MIEIVTVPSETDKAGSRGSYLGVQSLVPLQLGHTCSSTRVARRWQEH